MISLGRIFSLNLKKIMPLTTNNRIRFITTSKKDQDTASVAKESGTVCKTDQPKPWVSYGFSYFDEKEDRFVLHALFFMTVTVCLICNSFLLAYRPKDRFRDKDWIQREAFIELRRREKEGLPLIDPNLIPLDKIILPTDEELENVEIII